MLESLNITLSCCLHLTPHFLPRKFHMHTVVWWESIVPALAMQITKLYPWPREVIWALDSGFLAPDYADTENTVQTPLPSKSSWPVSYKECVKLTDKTIIQKDTCTSMCLQQHSSQLPGHGNNLNSSISGWTGKKMWYIHIYTKRYYSVMKRNGVMPLAATQMNLDYPMKWSKSQRGKTSAIYHLSVESKIQHKWTYLQNRNRFTEKADLWLPRGRGLEKSWSGRLELARWKLLLTEWINKILLYNTGNHIQ